MADVIELTTAPAKVPRRVRRQAWLWSALVLVVMALQTVMMLSDRGVSARQVFTTLSSFPDQVLHKDPFGALIYLVLFPLGGYLSLLSMRMTLKITPLHVEFSSRLPSWLKFIQPDWRIERPRLKAVRVDLSRTGAAPAAARLRFEYEGGQRVVPLSRWYRLGQDVETQVTGLRRVRGGKSLAEQVPELTVVRALKEAGLEPAVDMTPEVDPLRKSPAGVVLVVACLGAMLYGLYAVIDQTDLYAAQPPWLFVGAVGVVAAFLAWEVLRRLGMPQDHKLLGVAAAAAMFGLAAWGAAPQINAHTSAGSQQIEYRYTGDGVFEPVQPGPPALDLSRYVISLQHWKAGDRVTLTLRHGALGFWQYDRDIAINALDEKQQVPARRPAAKSGSK